MKAFTKFRKQTTIQPHIQIRMNNETIVETIKDSVRIIRLNKPRKKNAIDGEMYIRITELLNDAATNDDISMVVLTGTGDFYSSGNDLTAIDDDSSVELLKILQNFIEAFINFPKLLIAIVNGPAVGIAVTTLPFCDFVFATENAYFYTPFTKLGIVAEACSTITFPKILGERKAMEMLLLNYKMPAKEALVCGFISSVFKAEELCGKAWDVIAELSNLSTDSVLTTKRLMRRLYKDDLLKTNVIELKELERIKTKSFSKL